MAVENILVPYAFAPGERKALDFVIRTYANREDVRVTLFHTYVPLPDIDVRGSPVLTKMRSGVDYLSEELREREEGLQSAKEFLVSNGFSEDQVEYVFKKRTKSIAEEIIDTTTKGHYRVLVLSRQPGKAARMFARSVHSRALSALKDVTICLPT